MSVNEVESFSEELKELKELKAELEAHKLAFELGRPSRKDGECTNEKQDSDETLFPVTMGFIREQDLKKHNEKVRAQIKEQKEKEAAAKRKVECSVM